MKNISLVVFIYIIFCSPIFGQSGLLFSFEQDTNYQKYFYVDSNESNNQWQVGRPSKAVFDAAFNLPNALMTDTVSTYAPSNTSSFLLRQIVMLPRIDMYYYYKMNSDTLVDYAKIETSINGGLTWIDMSAPISPYYVWFNPPINSGNTNGWELASLEFYVDYFGLEPGDTVLFKFSFVSDGIDTYKDGWMIDNLFVIQTAGIGIDENTFVSSDLFKFIYTRSNKIEIINCLDEGAANSKLQICDLLGNGICSFELGNEPINVFNLPDLPNGLYLCYIEWNGMIVQTWKFVCIK